ncbi:MAG: helix-hairpin-helix domain-containing protein [Anaerolineales bacterium]|nr:helix-hairpin-helix domain-containing protein [Anaerolineales bacterium]
MSTAQRLRYGAGYMVLAALLATLVFMVVARRPAGQAVVLPDPATPAPLRVHVVGAVWQPGVYALPPGSIAQDAIEAAGGATTTANLQGLNLAALLHDGEQIIVPQLAGVEGTNAPAGGAAPTPPGNTTAPGELINVNTATAAELETLPEIGPALAQRIVDYRTAHGPFTALDDLLNVSGIGPATLDAIRGLITLT